MPTCLSQLYVCCLAPGTMTNPTQPMPASMPRLPPLTLVVATTPSLGIGLRGTLPWPPLKADLAFFARVTKRLPNHPPNHPSNSSFDSAVAVNDGSSVADPVNTTPAAGSRGGRKAMNAVLMGRNTWESIPPKFRPLQGRVNIVISHDVAFRSRLASCSPTSPSDTTIETAGSVEDGLHHYQKGYVGRVFVIGGARIYEQAMKMEECERVIWTRIRKEFECDTWFPGDSIGVEGQAEGIGRWKKRNREDLDQWCGEEGTGGLKTEGEVEFEFEMWERERIGS